MRMRVLAAGLSVVVGLPVLLAQTPGVIGGLVGGVPSPQALKGKPYSLVEKTTRVQTLTDGTTITQVTELHKMRDSEGRERTESWQVTEGQPALQWISLTDPAERTRTVLFASNKTGQVTYLAPPQEVSPEAQARRDEARAKAEAYRKEHPELQHATPGIERLSAEDIAGEMVEGMRMTRTIPVGKDGNDREIKVVTETWFSEDLREAMRFVMDDPRVGKTTTEVTELQRMEPDPALFRVPEGYKVLAPGNGPGLTGAVRLGMPTPQ